MSSSTIRKLKVRHSKTKPNSLNDKDRQNQPGVLRQYDRNDSETSTRMATKNATALLPTSPLSAFSSSSASASPNEEHQQQTNLTRQKNAPSASHQLNVKQEISDRTTKVSNALCP
jgi:hypothetical protein